MNPDFGALGFFLSYTNQLLIYVYSVTLLLPIAFEWRRCKRVKVSWSWTKYEIQRYLIQLDLWTLKPIERSPLDPDLESVNGLISELRAFHNFRIMNISQKRFNYLIRSTVPDIIQKFFNFFFYAICRKKINHAEIMLLRFYTFSSSFFEKLNSLVWLMRKV